MLTQREVDRRSMMLVGIVAGVLAVAWVLLFANPVGIFFIGLATGVISALSGVNEFLVVGVLYLTVVYIIGGLLWLYTSRNR